MFTRDWGSLVVLFIISTVVLISVGIFSFIFYHEMRDKAHRLWGLTKLRWHNLKRKYGVVFTIATKIKGSELSYSVDVIFQLFDHFYLLHQHEMEHWGWDPKLFPNGRKDVSDMYRWIAHTRAYNYTEAANITNLGTLVEYWGAVYTGFRYRFSKYDELIVVPLEDIVDNFHYERTYMKIVNHLYTLDSEKCFWILERRKVFGF